MSRTYTFVTCYICKKQHSANGAAKTAHMRKHVREGLLVETKDFDGFVQFNRTPATSAKLMAAVKAILEM